MKYILLAVLLFSPLTLSAHSPTEFLDLIEDTKKSVVHVLNTPDPDTVTELPTIAPKSDPEDEDEEGLNPRASGTGFIVEGGYIVTNWHVITDSIKLEVFLEDDPRPYPVTLVGSDEQIDIAVLKVDDTFPKDIKPLQWRTEKLRVGTEVWAVGHPAGLDYSISKGIVSHLDRRLESPWQPTIQTDTAINQGNSGGPLLDMDGNVVGVNVMIISRVAENNGLALAIDGFTAMRATETLIAQGEIVRPLMGVMLGYDSDAFRVKAEGVSDDGAAGQAGIKADDLYLEVGGVEIINVNDVFDVLAQHLPGDIVVVKLLRDGKEVVVEVELGRKPTEVDQKEK